MILFGFPPLIAGDLLLEMERACNWPIFDATRGGDPLLWQQLFLDFRTPGSLHRLFAILRADCHDRADDGSHEDAGLWLNCAGRRGNGIPELWFVGASHVHDRTTRNFDRHFWCRVAGCGYSHRRSAVLFSGDADCGRVTK